MGSDALTKKETDMPKSNRGAREENLPLALELLSSDHRKVEALFAEYEELKEQEDASRVAIAQQICAELTVHAQVEEDLFYPWLRENMDDTEHVAEAEVEHKSAKQLIAEIMPAGEADESYDAKVLVLKEYINHHVKEEENEIFPEVADSEEELDELGQEMAARKAELMEEMGMLDAGLAAAAAREKKGAKGDSQRPSR
jgi:hemerythrin superfamily protein